MKLNELNYNLIIEKQQFGNISKELDTHLKKLEQDANSFHLGTVTRMVNKADEILDNLHNAILSNKVIRDLDDHLSEATKKLTFFKERFNKLMIEWSKMEFEKDIILDAVKILTDLIKRIDLTLAGGEQRIKALIKQIAKEESNKTKRIFPKGLAQTLDTKQVHISKK